MKDKYLVTIHYNKNEYPGQFIIGELFYDKVKQYISLRPDDQFCDRLFIHYHEGRCTRQPIGRHKIGEVPGIIATYLGLSNPKTFTGHCFRRTSATLLSESGANMQMIKQLGRWRSDIIAQSYIENSMHNRQMIFDGIVHRAPANTSSSNKSSSGFDIYTNRTDTSKLSTINSNVVNSSCLTKKNLAQATTTNKDDLVFDDLDFSEDFVINNIHLPTSKYINKKNPITHQTIYCIIYLL